GYVLAGGKSRKPSKAPAAQAAQPTGKRDARNAVLEAAIVANPTDRDAYAVFADWLQEQGDPRGELMSLQLGHKDKQAKSFIEKHVDYFLGPLAPHQTVYDKGLNNSRSHLRTSAQEAEWQKTQQQAFLWRNGYIYRVRLSHDEYSTPDFDGEISDILAQTFAHPSGRYVVELAFQSNGDPNETDLQSIIDVIAKKAPPTVRKITFGDNVDQVSWHHTGNLGKLWKGVPGLKTLEIETGELEVGKMVAPALERAVIITGGLSKSCGKHLATAAMPKIRHLEIYYGDAEYGGDCTAKEVKPLLDRSDLSHLTYLGLKNAQFSDEIAKLVGGTKVLKTLKTLDLSLGTMTDEGAAALAAAKDSLKHLEVLDLTRNYLSKDGIKLVKGICPKVVTSSQEEPDEDDGQRYYYVSIAE
ncbi:MAG TPA: TIGR02996 domain-containing protein, partial [Kofleriaceae bacterium]|nr:TIGR02996 domain-containing protein [Kofleriaceae bacterium]